MNPLSDHHTRKALHEAALIDQTADFFRVLGDPTRTRLLFALMESEMCVCDLAALLGMTKSAISHQLATLREAHFVTARRAGKHIYYALADAHIRHILHDGFVHVSEPSANEASPQEEEA